ncbi:MAG: hypothetical protein HC809_07385 [Gammaproteobacteria bacterium]|nr:hypothetical protein [Gammaproteobacteria bacterium]
MTLEEEAITLLLRSPRLAVGQIIDMLGVSDAQFREMTLRNDSISNLLAERRAGTLEARRPEPTQCPACDDWFMPYAGARFCSDPCRVIGRINEHARRRAPRRIGTL